MIDENHEIFKAQVRASWGPVWLVAHWWWGQGYGFSMPPPRVAPTRAEWRNYSDHGDIFIDKPGESQQRIEVKQTSHTFTGLDDWPFRDYLIMSRSAWDRAVKKPTFIIHLSADQKHMGIVDGMTYLEWWIEPVKDSRYTGLVQEQYKCDPGLIIWRTFNDPL